jgi:RNA polymerase sigma factor (sigma-70 family)
MKTAENTVEIDQKSYEMPPKGGISIAHFLTVTDIERSARYYEKVFGARILSLGDGNAMNAALMRLRGSRRKRETSLDDVTEAADLRARFQPVETRLNPEQEYLSKEARVLLQKGLKRLRPLYVEVLRLRGLQELSAKETARMLELPVGTVKARLHRARTTLARHVKSIVRSKRHRRNIRS